MILNFKIKHFYIHGIFFIASFREKHFLCRFHTSFVIPEGNSIHKSKSFNRIYIGGIILEYKTPFIAKKLGVSPKAVVRIAQQLNLTIEKINMVTLFLHKMI